MRTRPTTDATPTQNTTPAGWTGASAAALPRVGDADVPNAASDAVDGAGADPARACTPVDTDPMRLSPGMCLQLREALDERSGGDHLADEHGELRRGVRDRPPRCAFDLEQRARVGRQVLLARVEQPH